MKKLALILVFGSLLISGSAFALSSEQKGGQNSDGSPKFADPDEQMPAFMVPQSQTRSGSGFQPLPEGASLTPLQPGQYDNGAAAFQKAYTHQSQ